MFQIVSTDLAAGEVTKLDGLVSTDAISELQTSIERMTMAQRNEISVIKGDIYLSFPYQVGIMFDESNDEVQKRWVEITMVFHVLKGLQDMLDNGVNPPINVG